MAQIQPDNHSDAESQSDIAAPAMSAQQRRFSGGSLATYKDFVVGDSSWLCFVGFEIYNLLLLNLSGALGIALRGFFLRFFLKEMGRGVVVGRGVTIRQPQSISIGDKSIIDDYAVLDVRGSADASEQCGIDIGPHVVVGRCSIIAAKEGYVQLERAVNIGSYCRIATQSRIQIGESTLIAAYAYLGPGNHGEGDGESARIEAAMEIKGGVRIGSFSWIGARATVLDGVTIGQRAVVGAHAFVRDNVPENAVAVGIPATSKVP